MARTSIFGVIFASIILYCARIHEVAAEFYKGCSNSTSSCREYSVTASQLPFSCIKLCIKERLSFAAIQNGNTCTCCSSVVSWIDKSNCAISCPNESSHICGGNGFKSVYTTALPVIYKVSMTFKSETIPVHSDLNLETTIFVNRMFNESKDLQSIQGMNQTLNKLYLTWELNGSPWNYSIHSLVENTTKTNKTIGFSIPGNYKLCVIAKNLISEASGCRYLDVLVPVSGLHLVDVQPKTKILVDGKNVTLVEGRKYFSLKVALDEGSRVDFSVSFEDGFFPVIISSKEMQNPYAKGLKCVTTWHKYHQCGNYTVQVDVSNTISKVSLPVIPVNVQEPVTTAAVPINGALPGEWFKIKVLVNGDDNNLCSFRYNWTFDNWKTVNTTTVPYIEHKSHEVKKQNVSVKIFNDINNLVVDGTMYIQTPLSNVTLSFKGRPSSTKYIFKEGGDSVILHAEIFPYFDKVLYSWYFNGIKWPGNKATNSKKFSTTERVHVVAKNVFANDSLSVSSNTLVVVVEKRITKVTLHHSTVTVSKQNFSFTVELEGGSNVNILWDFGDGSTMTSTHLQVTHYYMKEGLYNVKVMAYNNISQSNDSSTIFVTKIPSCQPPNVKILDRRSFEIYRFEEVSIESQVTIDCSWEDFSLVYKWKIVPHSENASTTNMSSLQMSEAVLIIPPYTLDIAKYDIILKVHKNNTVLFDEKKIEIDVVRHGLIASIKGGSNRVIGYGSKLPIILDGRESTDTDFPNESENLRFNWECHLLTNNATPCFDLQSVKIDLNQASFKLPIKDVQGGVEALLVTLTVSKGDMKNKTWQILRMVNDTPHLLSVQCPQCEQTKVNYNDALILQGDCATCSWNDQDLDFNWELYLVSEDPNFSKTKCMQHAQMPPPVQKVASQREPSTPTTVRPHKLDVPKPSHQPPTQPSRGRSTGRGRPGLDGRTTHKPQPPPTTGPYLEKARIEVGETCNSSIKFPSNCRQSSKNSYWLCVSSRPTGTPTDHPSHHTGVGSGSRPPYLPATSARGSTQLTQRTLETTQIPVPSKRVATPTKTKDRYQDIRHPQYVIPEAARRYKMLAIKRNRLLMEDSWTNTGLKKLNFVLKKQQLVAGKTYMIALVVQSQQRGGMANVFFKVNDIPAIGEFAVEPLSGHEIEQEFRLKGQGGSHKRLHYQVTYKIHGEEDREFLLYKGTNLQPSFNLPSGLKEHDFNVSLFISAYDKKGSTVHVCPKILQVKPTMIQDANVSLEEYLLNKTRSTYIQTLIKVGKEQQVKQFVKVLSEALNRLAPVKNTSSKFHLRTEARHEMVNVISKFRVRDMTSAIQTAEALEALTRVKTELNIEELEEASQLIFEAESLIVKQASRNSNALSTNLLNLLTKGLSNILASSLQFQRSHPAQQKKIQLQSVKGIQDVIKSKLKNLVLGEKSSKVNQPSFSAVTSQSKLLAQSNWTLKGATFILPSQMGEQLRMKKRSFSAACVGATMIVYEENPYTWKSNDYELYETKASSLVISSCNAEPIKVSRLKHEIEVVLPWLVKEKNNAKKTYTVNWQYLNVHSVYLNNSMENHTLQLDIQILSKLDHGMVLIIFVSLDSKEDIQQASTLKTSSGGSARFEFTAKDLINASNAVRIGIVMKDTDLNRIKKVFSATPVNYSISSKWIGCYYWDEDKQFLSTHGCFPTENSTDAFIKCRCNHLTTFVGKAFWSPNPLSIKDLRDIRSISRNPVCLALVLSLLALYILLFIYCYKLDKENKGKGDAIVLTNILCSRSSYRYKITVETGHWFGSGTSSSVVMRMFGEKDNSDPIELKSKGKTLFSRGSKDVFIFDSPCDMSPLKKIHVWHYNEGGNPSWFLDRIIVQDMTTGEKWYFDNYRWLAIDEEDGKVDVELLPVDRKKHVSKLQLYYHQGRRYLLDYHLWLSVYSRPSSSYFNHKQRLTCCLSLVLSFLCVNAAWFHVTSSGTKLYETLGMLDLSWETVLSGILCSLVVLPGNLLWMIMFRYAKPFDSSTKKVHPTPYDDPITEPITETSCIVNSTDYNDDSVSILDQTIETLLYLKALGRKIRPFSSHWYDRNSIDSAFPNLEDDHSYYSVFEVQTSCGSTKAPSSPLQHDDMSLLNSEQPSEVAKETFSLPHYCVSIAWIGCGLTIVSTGFITVWYGLSFGRQKSILWLQSLCFSVLESVLISQPFMILAILIYSMCSNLIRKSPTKVKPIIEEDEDKIRKSIPSSKTSEIYMNLKTALHARRHQRYLKFLKPLNKSLLSDASEKQHIKNVLYCYVRDVITCLVGLVLVCVLVSSMYCRSAFDIRKSVQNTILKHSASEIGSARPDLWWKTNHEQIVNVLYWRPYEWSLWKNRTSQIFFKDTLSVIVGKPRIRRYTARKLKKCSDVDGTTSKRKCWSRCLPDSGHWSFVELSRTRSIAKEELRELTTREWISFCTEHITIDFVLYAASLDVYSVVSWEVNGPSSGQPHIQIQVKSIKDAFRGVALDIFLKVCKGIFVATFVFCLYSELVYLTKVKSKYFKSVWKYIEIFLLLLSAMSIVSYVNWSVSVYSLIREILSESGHDVYAAVSLVYHRQELLVTVYSLILFLLVLKIIHLLKVFKFVQRFCYLLWTTCGFLAALMVLVLISVIMLSHFGYLLFGRVCSDFMTFSRSVVYTFGLLRLRGKTEQMESVCFPIMYYFTSVFLLAVVLRGLSIAIFSWSVHSLKRRHHPTHLLIDYVKNLNRVSVVREKTIVEESDDEDGEIIPVEYACDEMEIQMGELLFKMENLIGESKLADLRLASSSDLLLSSDVEFDYDYDVEYLYRQGEIDMEQGSGYDSDQSFYSHGSGSPESQEGLTDLELQRRISNVSCLTTSIDGNPPAPSFFVPSKAMNESEMNISLAREAGDLQHERLLKEAKSSPKQLYRSQSNSLTSHSSVLLDPSSTAKNQSEKPPVDNDRSKNKTTYHPLTRKPKFRQGQICLDDIPKDIGLTSSSGLDEYITSREDNSCTQKSKKSSKKTSYLRTLGLLPKTSVAPIDDRNDKPLLKGDAFNSSSDSRHFTSDSSICAENQLSSGSSNHFYGYDVPLSPSEPGFSNNGFYKDNQDVESVLNDDEMASLPGLIGDICTNNNIGTNIGPAPP